MKKLILPILLAVPLMIAGCSDDGGDPIAPPPADSTLLKTVSLRFVPKFGDAPLLLGRKYLDAGGDSVRFTTIRLYISEMALIDSSGAELPMPGIALVDFGADGIAASGYATVTTRARAGAYRGIRFSIGVPTADNHRDAATQTLPLGPNSGMYWGWNPGYIFHMIEGKADSASGNVDFTYHIGEDNHKVTVLLANLSPQSPTTFTVGESGDNIFTIDADYAKLFAVGLDGSTPMKLSANPGERTHHMTPKNLVDRTSANTRSIFTRES